MEYNLSKQSIGYCDKFLDTVNEQIVDADISLPDYCPDIEKILRCTLIPKIYTRHISGGQLTIDGVSQIRILYCDSIRHNIRCFEHTVPFSSNFNLKTTPQQYIVLGDTKCEYINCRALSPRKLVVHGAFSLYAKVLTKETCEIFDFEEECDLQTKKRQLDVSDMCFLFQEQFSVNQDISVDSKPVESLLSYNVSSFINDIKTIGNKLMLNGELQVNVMYLSDIDTGETDHLTYTFEINKIFDCDGLVDDAVNVPKIEVMSCDIVTRNDTLKDTSQLCVDAKLCFSCVSYANRVVSILDDVYSTKYSTEEKRSSLNCECNHRCENIVHIIKQSLILDGVKIKKMLDVHCDNVSVSAMFNDNKLSLSGKANICMLFEDDDNTPCYVERTLDVDFTPDLQDKFDRAMLDSCVAKSLSFRIADDHTVELRLELIASLVLCETVSLNPVVQVIANEECLVEHDDCALVMYYADKGESVWDIAKAYNTTSDVLISENSLDSDVLDSSRMLLVVT